MDRTVESMKVFCVQDNPSGDEEYLSNNKAKASEEAGNATTPSLCWGLLSDQLLLECVIVSTFRLAAAATGGFDDTAILSKSGSGNMIPGNLLKENRRRTDLGTGIGRRLGDATG